MQVTLTVFKDQGGLYPDGDVRIIQTPFEIQERGEVSLVDANDIVIDYSRPYATVTAIMMQGGQRIYVSETRDEIEAKMVSPLSPGAQTQTKEFTIGTDIATGNVVTMPTSVPDDADILAYFINNVEVNNEDVVFTSPRTYDFTAVGGLTSGVLKVIFNP